MGIVPRAQRSGAEAIERTRLDSQTLSYNQRLVMVETVGIDPTSDCFTEIPSTYIVHALFTRSTIYHEQEIVFGAKYLTTLIPLQ